CPPSTSGKSTQVSPKEQSPFGTTCIDTAPRVGPVSAEVSSLVSSLAESAFVELAPAVSLLSDVSTVSSPVVGSVVSPDAVVSSADVGGSVPSLASSPQAEPTEKLTAIAMHAHPRFLNMGLGYHSLGGRAQSLGSSRGKSRRRLAHAIVATASRSQTSRDY